MDQELSQSYLEKINARRYKEQKLIKQGVILQYLQDKSSTGQIVSVCEIASDLSLTTASVRSHLNQLVEQKKVLVENAPHQNKLESAGLVYRCN